MLQDQIAKGYVRVENEGGIPLYHFPESSQMTKKTVQSKHEVSGSKQVDDIVMNEFSHYVKDMEWSFTPKDTALASSRLAHAAQSASSNNSSLKNIDFLASNKSSSFKNLDSPVRSWESQTMSRSRSSGARNWRDACQMLSLRRCRRLMHLHITSALIILRCDFDSQNV